MEILDGKKLAGEILSGLKEEVKKIRRPLALAVIMVGNDPASLVYCRQKEKAAKEIGVGFKLFRFPKEISQENLKKEIEKIAQDSRNSGLIIQLPLPQKFNQREILNLIPPEKDVDVLTERSLVKFYSGLLPITPPLVAGISNLLEKYNLKIKGKKITVFGAGRLVGFPIILWLVKGKATVCVVNELTRDIGVHSKTADIIISGVGKPGVITGDIVKKGAVVIDAGTAFLNGKTKGDVDFESVSKVAGFISKVPGGIGPMTVVCLLDNLVKMSR